jgi:hypothetical protein
LCHAHFQPTGGNASKVQEQLPRKNRVRAIWKRNLEILESIVVDIVVAAAAAASLWVKK